MKIHKWLHSFINLFFPHCCVVCGAVIDGEGEKGICVSCLGNMPKTNYHLQKDNEVAIRFWGKFPLERASAYLFYKKDGGFHKLLYALKYYNDKQIGRIMGRYMAAELLPAGFFADVDLLIPLPLHPKKEAKRGYNQSEWLAMGISEITGLRIETTAVRRMIANPTQTKKKRLERWQNTKDVFEVVNPAPLEGKHLLLIDDVLTTGATITSCALSLIEISGVKVSVLTLSVA